MKAIIQLLCGEAFPCLTYPHQALGFAVLIPFLRGACGKSTGECEKVLVITAQEFDEALAAGEDDVTERGRVPGGPIITIDEPADSDVLPPVRVDMRFLPPTGSTIDLDTLRVSGALSMSLPV